MVIRSATLGDAPAIAAVHVETWREAYRGVFPPEFLDAMSVEHRRGIWERILAHLPGGEQAHVADDGAGVVGFSHCGPSRDEDGAGAGELYAVYVAPLRWGAGVGQQLMAAARQALVDRGWNEATLWVLEPNARARAFYEKDGWVADGAGQPIERGGVSVLEIRYRRSLR